MKFKQTPIRIFGKIDDTEAACLIRRNDEIASVQEQLNIYYSGRKKGSAEMALRYIRTFPEICQFYTERLIEDDLAMAEINKSPASMYYTLVGDYERAAPIIEPLLVTQGNGEYITMLIRWAIEKNITLRRRADYYYEIVQEDPYHAHKAVVTMRNRGMTTPAKNLLKRCIVWCQENKGKASAAAYIYVTSNKDVRLRDYSRVIQQNPFYSFRAFQTLWDRLFNGHDIDCSRVSPRWAYHLLLSGKDRVDRDALMKALAKDPAWSVEFLIDSGLHANKQTLLTLCEPLAEDLHHPLNKHLLNWIRSRKS
jgi:hypothetical protein